MQVILGGSVSNLNQIFNIQKVYMYMYVNIYIHLCADTIFNDRQKNSCLQTAYLVVKGKSHRSSLTCQSCTLGH